MIQTMFESYSITDRGNVRPVNQDYSDSFCGDNYACGVVCDGMGGTKGGNVASEFAGRWISEAVVTAVSDADDGNHVRKMVESALCKIPLKLYNLSKREGLEGMGTTAVLCVCFDQSAYVYNIGDSRCYLIREHSMEQITIDHSMVEDMIASGQIDRESGRVHPQKNIITRALGPEKTAVFDFFELNLKYGDIILLSSDGLTNMLDDRQILEIVEENEGDIVSGCTKLGIEAKNHGGHDNISVVLIKYDKEDN